MIGAIWDELFKMGDEVKKKCGADSEAYSVLHELDRRIQAVYDEKNALTEEVINKKPENESDMLVGMINGLKVEKDDEGYRYRLGSNSFETPAEVLKYMITDYNLRYATLQKLYEDMFFEAVEQTAYNMYKRGCAEFHEMIDTNKPRIRTKFMDKVGRESK
ncbi:MAG: hypothetical protein IJI87_07580 [Mogibacterium sp.]|nr:hypothetical protein [Mogibacterium sp.]